MQRRRSGKQITEAKVLENQDLKAILEPAPVATAGQEATGFAFKGLKTKTYGSGKAACCQVDQAMPAAEAKDNPELKEHPEAALAAVTAKKHNALPVKDQRAKLLAQAN
eukprot:1895629-Amphidinium_carterae.1